MGRLLYDSSNRELEIDDRTLAHLRVAIVNKLRRNESFAFTWEHGVDHGSGRTTLWMHPSIPLQFVFNGNRPPKLNRLWIELLVVQASSPSGLLLVPEPAESADFESD